MDSITVAAAPWTTEQCETIDGYYHRYTIYDIIYGETKRNLVMISTPNNHYVS